MSIAVNPVPAPAQVEARAGRLLSVATRVDVDDLHFGGGQFRPDSTSGGIVGLCDSEKAIGDIPGLETAVAFGLWEGDRCSSAAAVSTREDLAARVRTKIEQSTGWWAEKALWTGAPATVPVSSSQVLASSAATELVVSGDGVGVVPGIAAVIAALNEGLRGARGVIHVPGGLVPYLEFYGQIVRTGNVLQVAGTDHVVVAGAGYPNTDRDGNEADSDEYWIYGTGAVNVRLGPVSMVGTGAEVVDRATNTIEVRAERAGLVWFDPTVHVTIPVCTPDPGPECSASSS